MGREKRSAAGPSTAKDRHRRAIKEINRNAPLPPGLVGRKAAPITKHKTVLELVENKDFKKKPLDFENTTQREPPPLFSFVPLGNPELTLQCKDMSRERGAMVYIVSNPTNLTTDLSHQMNRVGYHFRSQIVQEAKEDLEIDEIYVPTLGPHGVEVIPESQQEINEQANAALWELFPKIPHTDRAEIISHAFRKGQATGSEPLVGLQPTLSLFRRVQLAVLAHIRHNHTRYDKLLRETSWSNARRVTEEVCLDFLVKWRGDDESGRDQLDEIIREVVVLSDDDDSDDDKDSSSEAEAASSNDVAILPAGSFIPGIPSGPAAVPYQNGAATGLVQPQVPADEPGMVPKPKGKSKKALKREKRKNQKGFKRYEANNKRYETAWEDAVRRNRLAADAPRVATPHAPGVLATLSGFSSQVSSPRDGNMHRHGEQPDRGFGPYPVQYRNPRTPQGTGPDEFRPANGAHHAVPSPLAYGYTAPGQAAQNKVNDPVPSGIAHSRGWPPPGHQTPLQDLLHPSIEPLSPGVPPLEQAYRPLVYEEHPAGRRFHDPTRDMVVIHEARGSMPDPYPVVQPRYEQQTRGLEPGPQYEKHAPASHPASARYPVAWGAAAGPPSSSTWGEGHALIGDQYGARTGIDHRIAGPWPHPEDHLLHKGNPPADRLGPDSRIVEVRPYPEHSVVYAQERPAPQSGFLTLREHRPDAYPVPQQEPFVRLREAPVIHPESSRPHDMYRHAEPYHTYGRDPDAPHKAAYAAADPVYAYQEPPPRAVHGPYDYHPGPAPRPHEEQPYGYPALPEHPPPAGSSGYQHYSYDRRQSRHTPLQPSHEVIVIDS